jgi:hypothetical protein
MTDSIRAALDKAACAICLCEGECFETRHGMMHGPCEKLTGEAADAIAAFLRALPIVLDREFHLPNSWAGHLYPNFNALAQAVLAAAKEASL